MRPQVGIKTVLHVGRQYRVPVMKARSRIQSEHHREQVWCGLYAFCQQTIGGIGLILGGS